MHKRPHRFIRTLLIPSLLISTVLVAGYFVPDEGDSDNIYIDTQTITSIDANNFNSEALVDPDARNDASNIEATTVPLSNPHSSPINELSAPNPSTVSKPLAAEKPVLSKEERAWLEKTSTVPERIETVTLKKGDSLARVFKRLNLAPSTLHAIMTTGKEARFLSKLHPGQDIEFAFNEEEQLLGLNVNLSALNTTWITYQSSNDSYTIIKESRTFNTRVASASGTIDSSLFLAGQNVDLSEKTIMELANIFGWDIDFALDIRQNDSFSILYEENMLDGKKHSDGVILAAEFTNAGKTYSAIRFEKDGHSDYYSKEGYSLRKAFLRSPVDFARISSRFNLKRRHPILHTIRAHKGVDYAAKTGTPIKATGDGKVIHAARKGGYGRTVILQHGQKYTTLYAHLHRYGRGIKKGKRVTQGQVIGYVGSSGLATGPHLHYEFRTNGVHVNPLTVKVPKSDPVAKKYRSQFYAHAEKLLNQLPNSNEAVHYARTTPLDSTQNGAFHDE